MNEVADRLEAELAELRLRIQAEIERLEVLGKKNNSVVHFTYARHLREILEDRE